MRTHKELLVWQKSMLLVKYIIWSKGFPKRKLIHCLTKCGGRQCRFPLI